MSCLSSIGATARRPFTQPSKYVGAQCIAPFIRRIRIICEKTSATMAYKAQDVLVHAAADALSASAKSKHNSIANENSEGHEDLEGEDV